MSRVFANCLEAIKETDRELKVSGITVDVNHYQNKVLMGEERFTKELMGVSFTISKPLEKREEMIKFLFKEDSNKIIDYCEQEFKDRISKEPLNPGNSYKIRADMWQKFINEDKFDYTYSERMYDKLDKIKNILKEDRHSRQAILQIFHPKDLDNTGGQTRIPCSVDYQFMIRNNRLHLIYHMRSNDYFGHHAIDIYLAGSLIKYMVSELSNKYPELKTGSLIFFCASLHAYKWDLDKWVIF
jgi:thymidylate synthase